MIEVDKALYARLSGDATLGAMVSGVFRNVAPEGQAFPLVVFNKASGVDEYAMGGVVARDLIYVVKAICEGDDQTPAADVSARVYELLNDQALDVQGGVWHHDRTRRETDVEFTENDDGRRLQHVGGSYRVTVVR
jgi:hypothetical protein